MRALLSAIASQLGIDIEAVDIEERWARIEHGTLREALVECSDVTGAHWPSVAALTHCAAQAIISQQQYRSVGRELIAEYQRRNDGRMPYIPAETLKRWRPKTPVTREDEQLHGAKIAHLTDWLRNKSGLIKVRRGARSIC